MDAIVSRRQLSPSNPPTVHTSEKVSTLRERERERERQRERERDEQRKREREREGERERAQERKGGRAKRAHPSKWTGLAPPEARQKKR